MAEPPKANAVQESTGGGCLLRLFWFLAGNLILVICTGSIAHHRGSFLSAWDAAFWATVAALIAARYVDIVRYHGQTAAGQPATLSHWRRYAVILLVVAGVLWSGSHAWAHLA